MGLLAVVCAMMGVGPDHGIGEHVAVSELFLWGWSVSPAKGAANFYPGEGSGTRLGVVRAWLHCAEGQVEGRSLEGGVSHHSFNSPSSPVPHPHTLQGLESSPSLEWDLQFPARIYPGEEGI